MQALFELGKEFDWIHPELKQIIQNNYENELPAYKARARMVLKSLKKYQNQPKMCNISSIKPTNLHL